MQQFHPIHGQTEKNQFDSLMWLCAASDSAQCKYKRALFLHGCFFSSSPATPAANMINSSFVHRYPKMKRCPDSPRTVLEQALDFMSQRLFFKKLFYPNFCPNCKQDGISVPPALTRYARKAAGVRGASSPSRPARLSQRRIRTRSCRQSPTHPKGTKTCLN